MEIERKWLVDGWPDADLQLLSEQKMRQGYLVVVPTVRIREETDTDGRTAYILCLKSGRGIAREEIEMELAEDKFREIERVIGKPLIPKVRRNYALPGGLVLEVNHVDEGQPTEFWYAEIEFPSVEEGRAYVPSDPALRDYLCRDVTEEEGQSMGSYWIRTREKQQ